MHIWEEEPEMPSVLKLENVNAFYDKSHILFDLSLEVTEGSSVCLLGRNGVGKSTTMKTIMGIMNPKNHCRTEGRVLLNGSDSVGLRSNQIAQAGRRLCSSGAAHFSESDRSGKSSDCKEKRNRRQRGMGY